MAQTATSPNPFSPLASSTPEQYRPSEADRREAKQIMGKFYQYASARSLRDADWNFYQAFIEGNQLWYVSSATGAPVQVIDPNKRKRPSMFNVLKPTIRALRGKLGQAVPTFSVRPGTGSQEQIHAARMGDRIIEWYWDKEQIMDKFKECLGALPWAGLGLLHQFWNPYVGEELASCPNPDCGCTIDHDWVYRRGEPPEVACPKCGEEMLRIWSGDAEVRSMDPRSFYLQPGVTFFKDAEDCFTRELFPITKLAKDYPTYAAYLKTDGTDAISAPPGFGQVYNLATRSWQVETLQEHAWLIRYYNKASGDPLHPNGREVHLINGQIVEDIDPEFPMTSMPFYPIRWETTSGEFYPTPPMADAWPRQKELNALETVFREYAELCVRPKLILPLGTKLAMDEVSATTGQVLAPMPNFAHLIKFLPWPELPPFMMTRRDQLVADIRLIFGVTQTDLNIPVDGSGRTLAIQQAESDAALGHIVSAAHQQLARLTQDALELIRRMAPPSRKLAIMSDDGFELIDFQRQDYGRGWGIALESDDGMPKNRALRMQEALNLDGAGIFTDPQTGRKDRGLFAKAAKLKLPGIGPEQSDSEYGAVRAAVGELRDGPNFLPSDEDDMDKFIRGLMGWLRTTGRLEVKTNPQWVVRVRQLMRWYMQKQIQAQMAAQVSQGGEQPDQMASPPNSSQSAPGGSPNKPEDTSAGNPVLNASQETTKQADAAGNAEVRSQLTKSA